ncbi:DNA cytosine methyltransferase [Hymenobacter sp. BT683]|uniref:DNA (cytosine-5-)-methyltransferase n=1 Tax=Hymenobacter jeongseonensis TaxID=2791027 RepID=A0ABS0IMC4_9BACT|nr:DNA cytosine methyltransferase [Hymenobacter jeongseonensis]MBF9239514.1 DNA cytosine methyltransferase [Hymenobacter jeongseonensis]
MSAIPPPHLTVTHQIPVLSFFTGGGLLDMGFEEAGFDIVWTNELDPGFAKLYSEGITSWRRKHKPSAPEARISHIGNLLDITPAEIARQAFPKGKPSLFGIIGGPPCQDFSIAGSRQGIEGERGKITPAYCQVINELQPAFFVFENVTGLLQKNHRAEFDKLRDAFNRHYITDFAPLNALDYGVPQSRERLLLIGLRRDLVQVPKSGLFSDAIPPIGWANWKREQSHAGLRTQFQWPRVEELEVRPAAPLNPQQLELCVSRCLHSEEDTSLPNACDRFKLYSAIPAKTPEGLVNNRSFKRLHRYRYSPTACYGNNEVHLHPFENRRLSVREVLRIQSVDDSYVLSEGPPLGSKFKMIGNGVPVALANGVARTITRLLQEFCGFQQVSAPIGMSSPAHVSQYTFKRPIDINDEVLFDF